MTDILTVNQMRNWGYPRGVVSLAKCGCGVGVKIGCGCLGWPAEVRVYRSSRHQPPSPDTNAV